MGLKSLQNKIAQTETRRLLLISWGIATAAFIVMIPARFSLGNQGLAGLFFRLLFYSNYFLLVIAFLATSLIVLVRKESFFTMSAKKWSSEFFSPVLRARMAQVEGLLMIVCILGSVLFGLGVALGNGLSRTEDNANEWLTFTSAEDHLSIGYPGNWKMYLGEDQRGNDEELVVVLVYREGLAGGSITVSQKAIEAPTLEEVADWGEERITNVEREYEAGELEAVQVGPAQLSALTRTFLLDTNTFLPHRNQHIYLAGDHNAFTISLQAPVSQFEARAQDFERIVSSFVIVE